MNSVTVCLKGHHRRVGMCDSTSPKDGEILNEDKKFLQTIQYLQLQAKETQDIETNSTLANFLNILSPFFLYVFLLLLQGTKN